MGKRMERVEGYIPKALESLQKHFPENEIEKKYSGYIASFGASINQSGLIPTLAFFSNKRSDKGKTESAKSDVDRIKVIIILEEILLAEKVSEDTTLLEYVLENPKDEELLKEKIKRAAVALKLAIRTFKLTEGGEAE